MKPQSGPESSETPPGESIPVDLGARSYSIEVGAGLLRLGRAAETIATLAGSGQVCIVTHPGLRASYAGPLETGLRERDVSVSVAEIRAGERYKTLRSVARVYDALLAARLDRHGLVVAVGGGVLGDLAGFAAATYLRGVRFVQAPTTLLAQVDASVGGKTGVDLPAGKNLAGAFHQPVAVLIDTETLSTLPARELRAGLAEVLKYGIIYDESFFASTVADHALLLRRDVSALTRAIMRSCAIKAEVVSQDETEQGLRAILNFGHTIGHALETVTGYRRYRHGEAVAIGMVSAALIGEEVGITPSELTSTLIEALISVRLPVAFPDDVETESVIEAARHDKKARGGRLRFILARGIGHVECVDAVSSTAIHAALSLQRRLRYS